VSLRAQFLKDLFVQQNAGRRRWPKKMAVRRRRLLGTDFPAPLLQLPKVAGMRCLGPFRRGNEITK
jgi:hypothetical protein